MIQGMESGEIKKVLSASLPGKWCLTIANEAKVPKITDMLITKIANIKSNAFIDFFVTVVFF